MSKTDTRVGYTARLVSPFINTTGKCLELFYWIGQQPADDVDTSLKVIAISEQLTEKTLKEVSDLTTNFQRLFLPLPNGTHRIAIEGRRSETRKFSALSLDDVAIMDCTRFGKMKVITEFETR